VFKWKQAPQNICACLPFKEGCHNLQPTRQWNFQNSAHIKLTPYSSYTQKQVRYCMWLSWIRRLLCLKLKEFFLGWGMVYI